MSIYYSCVPLSYLLQIHCVRSIYVSIPLSMLPWKNILDWMIPIYLDPLRKSAVLWMRSKQPEICRPVKLNQLDLLRNWDNHTPDFLLCISCIFVTEYQMTIVCLSYEIILSLKVPKWRMFIGNSEPQQRRKLKLASRSWHVENQDNFLV